MKSFQEGKKRAVQEGKATRQKMEVWTFFANLLTIRSLLSSPYPRGPRAATWHPVKNSAERCLFPAVQLNRTCNSLRSNSTADMSIARPTLQPAHSGFYLRLRPWSATANGRPSNRLPSEQSEKGED